MRSSGSGFSMEIRPAEVVVRGRRALSDLAVDVPHDRGPPVDNWQHRIRLRGRKRRHNAGHSQVGEALYPVEILAQAERGDLDGGRIAAGFPGHLAEFRQNLGDIATGGWNPAVAVADRAACTVRKGAADMNRRVGF